MASVTTFPSHSSVPAYVEPERLGLALQQQQHDQATGAPAPSFNYLVDVPVSSSEVRRWDGVLADAESRARARLRNSSHDSPFAAGGLHMGNEEDADPDGGDAPNSFFLNADIVLNHMTGDAERRAAVYGRLAPFPPFDSSAVVTLPMTKALRFRREWLPYRQLFPMYHQRSEFMDALVRHDVVGLVGAPGSGRTLQTPILLSETEIMKRRRILVIAPNAVAARLTATRLRQERGEDAASRNVAVALPLLNEVTPGSVIIVTTAEVLLRQLLADPVLLDVGCVLVDDVHLRTAETELCLAMLRERIAMHTAWASRVSQQDGAAATGAAGAAPATPAVRRLHVVLIAPDEAAVTPVLEFFATAAPSTSAVVPTLAPCTTHLFALEGTSPVGSGSHGTAAAADDAAGGSGSAASSVLVRGPSRVVYYVEELVQWLHRCRTEGTSKLCADPEVELLEQAESVDVATRIMAAGDHDFNDPDRCREYWGTLIIEAVQSYSAAVRAEMGDAAAAGGASAGAQQPLPAPADGRYVNVLVVAPNATTARLLYNHLRNALNADGAGNEEEAGKSIAYTFTLLDEYRTSFQTFLALAQRTAQPGDAAGAAVAVRLLFTTPELAQTVIPPTVPVGLVVDCARTSCRSFDVAAAADAIVTEYSTTQSLRYRRGIAASAKGVDGGADTASALPFAARFMTVQLIPKSTLHSIAHRRFSADATQHHPLYRLPFERYLRLYQALQAREEAAVYARHLAIAGGQSSTALPVSILSHRAAQVLPSSFVAMPSGSSGNRSEALRRIMAAVENYLVAAGHIDIDEGHTAGHFCGAMKPLGALTALLAGPLPVSVARLLVLASLFGCATEATAVAAMWVVGDVFNGSISSSLLELATATADHVTRSKEELQQEEMELRELTKEARLYFSRDSANDVVSGFNVYKMWLSMRADVGEAAGADGNTGDTAPAAMSEDERAFLEECKVPRRLLAMIEATQKLMFQLMERSGLLAAAATTTTAPAASPAAAVVALPEDGILDERAQACISAALYPNCAVMEAGGRTTETAALVLLDSLHIVSAGRTTPTGAAVTARRLGVYSENSVVNDPATAETHVTGKPFLFLDKVVGAAAMGTSAAHVAVLEQAAPLQPAASIVFCGEGHVRQRPAPERCRGWLPSLTNAWRQTRRARHLPPAAQLPTPSIALAPYDTVRAESVLLTTDDNFQYTMRATTSEWLLRLRRHIQRQLREFLRGDQREGSSTHGAAAAEGERLFANVAEAWDWWARRRRGGASWLREERRIVLHGKKPETDGDEGAGTATQNLYGFFAFTTAAGQPQLAEPPKDKAKGTAAGSGGAAAAKGATTAAAPTPAAVVAAAAAAEGAGASVDGAAKPKVYTGALPNPDVVQMIRMCVKGVAKSHTRAHESKLLQDDPVSFAFLNPANEFHEYYLFLLRETAPTLEVLGDNLEELIEFLENVEKELRKEIGYKEPGANAAGGQQKQQQRQQQQQQQQRGAHQRHNSSRHDTAASQTTVVLKEVEGDNEQEEGESSFFGGASAGLQMETDASVRVKKQSLFNFTPRADATATTKASTTHPPAPAVVPDRQATATAAAMSAPGAPSGQQTLMEKLMAMKQQGTPGASNAGQPPSQSGPSVAAPQQQQQQQQHVGGEASEGTYRPPATMQELLQMLQPAGAPAPQGSSSPPPPAYASEVARPAAPSGVPTSAELLALLGAAPPPPTAAATATPTPPPPPPHGDAPQDINPLMQLIGGGAPMDAGAGYAPMADEPPRKPLSRPPPPLPAKVVEESPASVVVYPIPAVTDARMPALLSKALSDALDMRVGPATIVGRVCRIMVGNSRLAARAIAMRRFRCCGEKVYIFKNDRIIDNPDGFSSLPPRKRAAALKRAREEAAASRPDAASALALLKGLNLPTIDAVEPTATDDGAEVGNTAAADDADAALYNEVYGEAEDDDDPTSTTFNRGAAPGIGVEALSDSGNDE